MKRQDADDGLVTTVPDPAVDVEFLLNATYSQTLDTQSNYKPYRYVVDDKTCSLSDVTVELPDDIGSFLDQDALRETEDSSLFRSIVV